MSEQHTPGPWFADGQHVISPGNFHAYVAGTRFDLRGSLRANARLMAAAPCLLAELEHSIEREYNPFEPDNQSARYHRMKALYARATGATT